MSEVAVGKALREVATIVVFSSKAWGARVQDRKVVQDVARSAEAETQEVGTFSKKLLAGADEEYKALTKKINEARTLHYAMTLPYVKGQAIIPNTQMFEYIQRMEAMKREIAELKQQFKEVYPERMEQAIKKLGKLADRSKYPPPETIDTSFGIEVEFLPLPEADDFSYLPEGFAQQLGADLEKKILRRTEQAKEIGWKRLCEALDHAAERCLAPEVKRLYESMIDNLLDAAKVMDGFVEDGTPEKSAVRRVITFCESADIKQIRNSMTARKTFGQSAQEVWDRLRDLGYTS